LPSYYEQHGGFLITAAIDKYIFIGLNKIFTNDYVIKYSALEKVKSVEEIQHPIFRETLRRYDILPGIELMTLADIPAGTGLGSSGAFTVGLLRAIHAFRREYISPEALAEQACSIEMDLNGQCVGKQDQFVAALGGIVCLEISTGGTVSVSPLRIERDLVHHLNDHLLMFFTGYSREAVSLLGDQHRRTAKGDTEMLNNIHFIKETGLGIKEALEAGKPECFAQLMHEHWLRKRARTEGMSNPRIDHWYCVGMQNGALGGKLIGAGGGGFLLFYATNCERLREAMAGEGLQEVPFHFDHDGSVVTMRDRL
jgi:D-glycero-alpha-D-manno-heptose-7-phosphate kinase